MASIQIFPEFVKGPLESIQGNWKREVELGSICYILAVLTVIFICYN